MYLIDKKENRITKIEEKSFSELGFSERKHLQAWLAKNPKSLCSDEQNDDIIIIQEEFDGFNDTKERLDLLGIDKQGNLVIIENKLDDTGRDVTWQVLKYASYCSTLSKEQIKRIYQEYLDKQGNGEIAEEILKDFFGKADFEEIPLNIGQTQRIVMVAANFRKEVTSLVLWLLNFKLKIQCFKVTPFKLNEQLLLNIEQIIPLKEAENYVISMAEKTQEELHSQEELKNRHYLRIEFWTKFIKEMNKKSHSFQNISPSKDNWLGSGSGVSGVGFNVVISNYYARTEVYMSRSVKEENNLIFDELFKQKDTLETKFGKEFEWERLDEKKAARIKSELKDVDYFNKNDWDKMIDFMIDAYEKIELTFKEPLAKINKILKNKE
jgi:hypothetical protein